VAAAHRNLFGTGRYLSLEGVTSSEEQEAFLTYREPFISRWDVPLQLQIFQTDDATRPGTRIQQRGASIEASKVAFSRTRWSMRYEYKISECIEEPLCDLINLGEPVADIDRWLLNIQISSIQPTFFWDHRDDILDPHRGFFTSASLEYASPVFSADAHFLKEYLQGAWYLPVSARQVFAISGRVGLIQPKGGTGHNDVPLSERFTAGGEVTHRAFELDLLGTLCADPKDFDDDGFCAPTLFQRFNKEENRFEGPILPLGGSGLLLLNAEYRFPIAGTFGGAVFADVGNVYATDTIRWEQLRYGVGLGLRYLSPIGPLRFDFGYKLDRRVIGTDSDGNVKREDPFAWVITFGLPF
jgi:outer membrane protein insertion porin family